MPRFWVLEKGSRGAGAHRRRRVWMGGRPAPKSVQTGALEGYVGGLGSRWCWYRVMMGFYDILLRKQCLHDVLAGAITFLHQRARIGCSWDSIAATGSRSPIYRIMCYQLFVELVLINTMRQSISSYRASHAIPAKRQSLKYSSHLRHRSQWV